MPAGVPHPWGFSSPSSHSQGDLLQGSGFHDPKKRMSENHWAGPNQLKESREAPGDLWGRGTLSAQTPGARRGLLPSLGLMSLCRGGDVSTSTLNPTGPLSPSLTPPQASFTPVPGLVLQGVASPSLDGPLRNAPAVTYTSLQLRSGRTRSSWVRPASGHPLILRAFIHSFIHSPLPVGQAP